MRESSLAIWYIALVVHVLYKYDYKLLPRLPGHTIAGTTKISQQWIREKFKHIVQRLYLVQVIINSPIRPQSSVSEPSWCYNRGYRAPIESKYSMYLSRWATFAQLVVKPGTPKSNNALVRSECHVDSCPDTMFHTRIVFTAADGRAYICDELSDLSREGRIVIM